MRPIPSSVYASMIPHKTTIRVAGFNWTKTSFAKCRCKVCRHRSTRRHCEEEQTSPSRIVCQGENFVETRAVSRRPSISHDRKHLCNLQNHAVRARSGPSLPTKLKGPFCPKAAPKKISLLTLRRGSRWQSDSAGRAKTRGASGACRVRTESVCTPQCRSTARSF